MNTSRVSIFFLNVLVFCFSSYSQDSILLNDLNSQKYLKALHNKTEKFGGQVDQYTAKVLNKVLKQERKMQRRMAKIDSVLARSLFSYAIDSLQELQSYLRSKEAKINSLSRGKYFPYLDTLKQSLAFLSKTKQLLTSGSKVKGSVSSAMEQVEGMEGKLATTEKIQEYLKERQGLLKDQLKAFPFLSKYVRKINKEGYYYTAQINEYKEVLSDPSRIEKILVNTLSKLPSFQKFMRENSQLAALFPTVGAPSASSGNIPIVNGIPSRSTVQQAIQTSAGGNGTNITQFINQQTAQVQGIAERLKNKVNQLGGMGENDVPDFRPNNQKTKSLRNRLEYGTDLQFGKSTNFLPGMSNIGLHLGYKLNDKSSVGIGGAYRLGLGDGWNNVNITHQGIGLRSYINWKIKGSFYVQGGSEWNYNSEFKNIQQLKSHSLWQQSAVLGISKKYQISKKLKGNVQAMFDFLYRQHVPHSQPVLFRFGYGF
jgi:hypothetical protein